MRSRTQTGARRRHHRGRNCLLAPLSTHENSSTWYSLHTNQLVLPFLPLLLLATRCNLISSGESFDALDESILHLLRDLAEATLLLQICIDQGHRFLQLILNSVPRRATLLNICNCTSTVAKKPAMDCLRMLLLKKAQPGSLL